MIFKSRKQLESYLMKKCEAAIRKTRDEIYDILDSELHKFYNEFEPYAYHSTQQLLHSLVKTEVVRMGNAVMAEVYFDADSLNYITGSQPLGSDVVDAAAHGLHGATGGFYYVPVGNGIWDGPMATLDAKIVNNIVDKLKALNVPIQKR
jgi:hypothetical protein